MTITAKFASTCPVCNCAISPGTQVEWERGQKARHTKCPAAPAPAAGTIHLSGGSGYGCDGWTVGQVVVNVGRAYGSTIDRNRIVTERVAAWRVANPAPAYTLWQGCPEPQYGGTLEQQAAVTAWQTASDFVARRADWDRIRNADDRAQRDFQKGAGQDLPAHDGPEYLLILTAKSRRVREDGMSFGVGDDSGTLYSATARAATEEESAPLRTQLGRLDVARDAQIELRDIVESIGATGTQPASAQPTGEIVWSRNGGSGGYFERLWIDVSGGQIWHDRYNGADGDDWSYNNCGGYAVVRYVAWTADLDARIRARLAVLAEVSHAP
jgi:hypothetical protein